MGRKKKYDSGAQVVSLSIEGEVKQKAEELARKYNMSLSMMVSEVLKKLVMNDSEFCRAMARKYARELAYWQTQQKYAEEDLKKAKDEGVNND